MTDGNEATSTRAGQIPEFQDFARTGPGTLAGRYMRLFWQPVFASKDLPASSARPARIMSEDFTVYRGESGRAYVVGSRCAHRNTQLSAGWVEGEELRCSFHGWKYDGNGQCTEQPGERAPFCSRIRIRCYPTQEYLGHVFAYLGEGEPPEFPRYPAFEADGVLDSYMQRCNWNYFLQVENIPDEVHVSFVHRDSVFGEHGLFVVPEISAEESEWGITTYATRPGEKVRSTLHGMPNIGSWGASPRDAESGFRHAISWRVPIDDEHHGAFNVFHVNVQGEVADRLRAKLREWSEKPLRVDEVANEVLRGELDIRDLPKDPRLLNRQHVINAQDQVAQAGQGRVDRASEQLGQADVGVILLRRVWARELKALADGRPLTQWTRPLTLNPKVGA